MANTYAVGESIILSATFTVATVNTDPTTVTLRIKDPTGNIDVYTLALATVTRDSAGVFHKDLTIDESGEWFYRWEGTGTCVAADEVQFLVTASEF